MKKSAFQAFYIHVRPLDFTVLESRILKRNPLAIRVNTWLEKAKEFTESESDITIINHDIEEAYAALKEFCLSKYYENFNK